MTGSPGGNGGVNPRDPQLLPWKRRLPIEAPARVDVAVGKATGAMEIALCDSEEAALNHFNRHNDGQSFVQDHLAKSGLWSVALPDWDHFRFLHA